MNRNEPKRAINYARQSAKKEESISIDVQWDANRNYAERRGYRIVETLKDPGVSGLKLAKRPGIRKAIEAVERGEADVILVYRWSRLSRRRVHQAALIDRIERAGGRVESSTEPVDTTTAGGKFSRGMFLEFSAFESDLKSEQWREAQARRVARGVMPGGTVPFGYRAAVHGEPPVPDPETADVVRGLFAAYLRGRGPQSLAHELNRRGLRTTSGHEWRSRTVSRMLDNPFYVGRLDLHDPDCDCPVDEDTGKRGTRDAAGKFHACPNRVEVEGAHEPLLDEETFEAYRRERDRRRQGPAKTRQPKWHLGSGLTVCEKCGGPMHVNSYRATYSAGMCTTHTSTGACAGVWINRRRLETAVALWLGGHVEEWANEAEAVRGTDAERSALSGELDRLRAEEERVRAGLRGALRLVTLGEATDEDYRAARSDADARLADIRISAAEVEDRLARLTGDADAYERILRATPEGGSSPEEWNALLRRIIRRIVVGDDVIVIEPWRGEPAILDRAVWAPRRGKRTDGGGARDARGRFTR